MWRQLGTTMSYVEALGLHDCIAFRNTRPVFAESVYALSSRLVGYLPLSAG